MAMSVSPHTGVCAEHSRELTAWEPATLGPAGGNTAVVTTEGSIRRAEWGGSLCVGPEHTVSLPQGQCQSLSGSLSAWNREGGGVIRVWSWYS